MGRKCPANILSLPRTYEITLPTSGHLVFALHFHVVFGSQDQVFTTLYALHLPSKGLGFNNANYSKRMSVWHLSERALYRWEGGDDDGMDYRAKRICRHFLCIGLRISVELQVVILCFYPSSSALPFPDDFIEKQWRIMTCLFCWSLNRQFFPNCKHFSKSFV